MLQIRFLGISAFEIITENGLKIFIDPCLSPDHDCPITADDIDAADLILVSHGAWDHVGQSIEIAKRTGAIFMSGHDVRALAQREGLPKEQILGTQPGATREVKGVRVRATVAQHASFISPEKDVYLSAPPLGFVIYAEGGVRIYHPGDTCLCQDIKLIGELCQPQIVMMPVDAVLPVAPAEMSPLDAAIATQWLGPDVVIPIHYYPDSKNPEEFAKHAETLASGTQVLLRPEGFFTYEPYKLKFL
jgi:L-ascorbate metabolism protein UlaG (beta-lactamase superfamily)